jgi:hypothetical protein
MLPSATACFDVAIVEHSCLVYLSVQCSAITSQLRSREMCIICLLLFHLIFSDEVQLPPWHELHRKAATVSRVAVVLVTAVLDFLQCGKQVSVSLMRPDAGYAAACLDFFI